MEYTLIMIIIAYLLGSVSFATLICHCCKKDNPNEAGSGNPGASNVLRIAGHKTALMVLLADMAKGALPTFVAYAILRLSPFSVALVGLAAFMGHCYPIWHGFKGGKGVATFMGVILATHWLVGLLTCGLWLLVAVVSRYAAVASLLSALFCPILLAKFANFTFVLPVCVMVAFIVYRHYGNIMRLKAGEENKITCLPWCKKSD